jgi:HYDIN/CFA65/VesB-like, Ig-like domain/Transmembrane protein 131-like N-terminal
MKRNKRFLFSLFCGLLCSTFSQQASANAGLAVNPVSVNFGSLLVNTVSSPQTITLTNIGNQSITIQQAASSIPQFVVSGVALPATVAPGQTASFSVVFIPSAAGTFSGSINFSLNRTSGGLKLVPLSGTGLSTTQPTPAPISTASPAISLSSTSLNLGSVVVGSTSSQSVSVTNTGTADLSISQISATGTGFTVGGFTLPVTVPAGQRASFAVTFSPLTSGSGTGSVTVVSNAVNTPTVTIAVSAMGTVQPSVELTWTDTSTTLAGFHVYRGARSGGPYAKITTSLVPSASYIDTGVQSGVSYYYVTTAVDTTGAESAYSNESSVAIP